MKRMWSSEVELSRLAANHLNQWAGELGACQEISLQEISNELLGIVSKLHKIQSQSISLQCSPMDKQLLELEQKRAQRENSLASKPPF